MACLSNVSFISWILAVKASTLLLCSYSLSFYKSSNCCISAFYIISSFCLFSMLSTYYFDFDSLLSIRKKIVSSYYTRLFNLYYSHNMELSLTDKADVSFLNFFARTVTFKGVFFIDAICASLIGTEITDLLFYLWCQSFFATETVSIFRYYFNFFIFSFRPHSKRVLSYWYGKYWIKLREFKLMSINQNYLLSVFT